MYRKSLFCICAILILGVMTGPAMAELVAYYPMNEGSGTTVVDACGNGHDGEAHNGAPTWVASQQGGRHLRSKLALVMISLFLRDARDVR